MNQNEKVEKQSKWKRALKMLMAGVAVSLALAPKESAATEYSKESGDPQKHEMEVPTMAKILPLAYNKGALTAAFGDDYTIQIYKMIKNQNGTPLKKLMQEKKFSKGVHSIDYEKNATYKILDSQGNEIGHTGFTPRDIEMAEENEKKSPEDIQKLINETEKNWQERDPAGGGEEKPDQAPHQPNVETSESNM